MLFKCQRSMWKSTNCHGNGILLDGKDEKTRQFSITMPRKKILMRCSIIKIFPKLFQYFSIAGAGSLLW